jgi:hypothetical protein
VAVEEVGAAVQAAQQRLRSSPWDLASSAADQSPQGLSPRARAARQQCLQCQQQLTAAGDERALRSLLPAALVPLFMDRGSANRKQQQQKALEQVEQEPCMQP